MIKSKITFLLIAILSFGMASAQKQQIDIQRVEPSFWWVGMKNTELQILVYGKDIALTSPAFQYVGVTLAKVEKTENPNFLFLYLNIAPETKSGSIPIVFQAGKKKRTIQYELKDRVREATSVKGFNSSDVIYLVMPDRFANGDETNDSVTGMLDKTDRSNPDFRHGGDLKGIENHIDYIKDLGVTAVWLNPVQENNQPLTIENNIPKTCYHGYAITDFYKVDPRFGSNQLYNALVKKFHDDGIKVIMDMVFNHTGSNHWFFKDQPSQDWYHSKSQYGITNYRVVIPADPYASQFDANRMEKGWFVPHMPDLNQSNPHVARYLIQNSIWWIEYSQLDGIRMDTHGYNEKKFMADWCKEVMNEYPNFNIVGEVWESRILATSYYQTNATNLDGYQGNLPSVTDFPLMGALHSAFNENEGWDNGLSRIYYTLVQDFAYTNANNNVTFLDNHDVSRFATVVGNDINKQKMGFAALLTLRGIPQIFYGSEIGMPGDGGNHGILRADMPGGWKSDCQNVFTAAGRTTTQNDLFSYVRTLLNWRKTKSVLHTGRLMHYLPENGTYVYFRYNETESVMVILNNNNQPTTLDTKRFSERLSGFSKGKNIVTNEHVTNLQNLNLPAKSATIIELIK